MRDRREVQQKVLHEMGCAMGAFSMLRLGDRVAVGVSGGKDSMCLVHAIEVYRLHAAFPSDVIAVTVD